MLFSTLCFLSRNYEPYVYTGLYLLISGFLKQKKDLFAHLYTFTPYKMILKLITYLHNFGLIIFSAYICGAVSYRLCELNGSINPLYITNKLTLNDPVLLNLSWLFTYSKIWEFLDTWLIMLKGIDTIFLQKFHHAGAILCWYLCVQAKASAIIIPTQFNAFVHTIMYAYYLLSMTNNQLTTSLKKFKPLITLLQLVQIISCNISGYYYIKKYMSSYDVVEVNMIGIMVAYGWILVGLFTNFFIRSYVFGSKSKPKTN